MSTKTAFLESMQKTSSSTQISEQAEETSDEPFIPSLVLKNVLGPFIFTTQIPDQCLQSLALKNVEIFLPIKRIQDDLRRLKNLIITGNNIYTVQSSLTAMLLHQGALYQKESQNGTFVVGGNKVFNIYDEKYNLLEQDAEELVPKKDTTFAGFNMILTVIPEVLKFDSVKNFEIKSRSSKTPGYGLLFVYAEPTIEQPQDCLDISALECIDYVASPEYSCEDTRWCRFSLSNEPVLVYDLRNFIDYDKPYEQWLTTRLKKASLYFDTNDTRYELSSTASGKKFKLCQLTSNAPNLAGIRSEGTPIKESLKKVIADLINWNDIIWSETSVTINGTEYGPITGVLWIKRKRFI